MGTLLHINITKTNVIRAYNNSCSLRQTDSYMSDLDGRKMKLTVGTLMMLQTCNPNFSKKMKNLRRHFSNKRDGHSVGVFKPKDITTFVLISRF